MRPRYVSLTGFGQCSFHLSIPILRGSFFLVVLLGFWLCDEFAAAANSRNELVSTNDGANLGNNGNWSLNHSPKVSEDATYTGTISGSRRIDGSDDLTVGSFNIMTAGVTFALHNNVMGSGISSLTLGGSGNLGNAVSGNASDLLYVASGATFEITGGPTGSFGRLKVVLGQSGSFNAAGTLIISSIISDGTSSSGITKTGAGTATFSGANTYTGGTAINGGTLNLGSTGAIGSSGTISFGGGTLQHTSNNTVDYSARFNPAANQQYKVDTNSQNVTWASALTSAGGTLTKIGSGILTLSGSAGNTYTGLTTISGGEIDLNKISGNAIAGDSNSATNDVVISVASLQWLASNQVGDTVTITLNSGSVSLNGHTETLGSFVNNGGSFVSGVNGHLTGTTLDLLGGFTTINTGAVIENNHINISGGINTIQAGGLLRLLSGNPAGLEMTGGTLILNSDSSTPGKLELNGNVTAFASSTTSAIQSGGSAINVGTIDLNSGTRTFTIANGSAAVDMSISAKIANGGLTKAGDGVLELTGASTYAGGTSINAGTLKAGPGSLVSVGGSITVNSGGTLLLSGNGRHIGSGVGIVLNGGTFDTGGFLEPGAPLDGTHFIGALTLNASSTIDFGAGNTSVLEFAGIGHHTMGGSILALINWNGLQVVGGAGDRLLFNGNIADFTTQFAQGDVSFNGVNGYNAIQIAMGADPFYEIVGLTGFVPVPEPGTWLIGGLALATLAGMQSRRGCRRSRDS